MKKKAPHVSTTRTEKIANVATGAIAGPVGAVTGAAAGAMAEKGPAWGTPTAAPGPTAIPRPCILASGAVKRIGFISTRIWGTDGVTLEARKWAHIFEGLGHSCFWMAGQLDAPARVSHVAPKAHFRDPEIVDLHRQIFGVFRRSREVTNPIHALKEQMKDEIYRFIDKFNLEVLVAQNILAIPVHVPLGLAMTEVIVETNLPTIGHHHDFAWERERFTVNAVSDHLQAAFPPRLHGIEHVVINSMA